MSDIKKDHSIGASTGAVGGAVAYQVNTSSAGSGPVVKTYPSTLTASYSVSGARVKGSMPLGA